MYAKVNKNTTHGQLYKKKNTSKSFLHANKMYIPYIAKKKLAKGRKRRKVKLKERKEKKMLERYVWNTGALEKLRMPKKILPP